MKVLVIVIMVLQSLNIFGQQNIALVSDSIYDKIMKNKYVDGWSVKREGATIRCVMVDTLCFMPGCCWELGETCDIKKKDSVIITIRFEEWNDERIKTQRKKNLKIINVLGKELIKEQKKHRYYKMSESEFQKYKYAALKSYWRTSKNGEFELANVLRLPDVRIGNVGVFVDLSFDYHWHMIFQDTPRNKVRSQLDYISYKILGKGKLITCRFEYE